MNDQRWPLDRDGAAGEVSVSLGSPADIDRLEPLWRQVHEVHQAADPELAPWIDGAASWRKRRELYAHCLASRDAFLLLAERGDRLIGYALVAVEPDGDRLWNDSWPVGERVAELETIAVVPEERGRGLGTRLLDLVDAELEARGIRDVVIGAVPGNRRAIELYERRGFRLNWVVLSRFASRSGR
ncbi:MAG TPA: GNAT family N-acetyltransferase [Thermoleophilia bacterium]|nr:GNAT family N-acetyltransferase [Thermoleophilia bacterium]